MALVTLRGIRFVRDETLILDGIDWTIREGEHWALIGANGSGKTTLLKVIHGVEWPTAGSVSLLGKRLGETDVRELRKRVGWVSSSLVERMPDHDTVRQVAVSGCEASVGLWREFTDAEWTRADHALDMVGIGEIAGRPWRVLSQGERQRTLIARALAARPTLLILDEPCAGLDPAARGQFLRDLGRLTRRRGAPGLIFVTHHIEEIGPWITHGLALHRGRALAKGSIERVITSSTLSEAFETGCTVTRQGGEWRLTV